MTGRYLPASDVLLPRDPALANSDDWPEFVLHDASVSLPSGEASDLVSLLLAHANHPLRVTGRLENPPPDEQGHLWKPAYRVTSDNAAGANKRRRAQDVFVELDAVRSFAYGTYPDGGVEIWAAGSSGWFVLRPARAYRRVYDEMAAAVGTLYFIVDACAPGKDPPPARTIFKNYSREITGDADDAANRIYRHRDFLLSCMMGGREGLAWARMPIYRHLYHKFPRDVAAIKKRWSASSSNPKPEVHSDAPVGRAQRADSESSVSTLAGSKRKRQESSVRVAAPAMSSPAPEEHSTTLCEAETPRKRGRPKKLLGRASAAAAGGLSATPANSLPPTPDYEGSLATPTNLSDSDSIPARAKVKSALRLRPTKPSKGLATAAGKSAGKAVIEYDEVNDVDVGNDDGDHELPPHRISKRKRDRSGRYRQDVDEGIDIPVSPSAESEDVTPPPLEGIPGSSADLPVEAMAAPDPLQDEVWTCALAGCAHKVYGAAVTPDVQTLIREHYALHAFDDDRRVQLVNTLRAPSLPVAHLLERVKRQARSDGFPQSTFAGTRYPKY